MTRRPSEPKRSKPKLAKSPKPFVSPVTGEPIAAASMDWSGLVPTVSIREVKLCDSTSCGLADWLSSKPVRAWLARAAARGSA